MSLILWTESYCFLRCWYVAVGAVRVLLEGDNIWIARGICSVDGLKFILHLWWSNSLLELQISTYVHHNLFSFSWCLIIPVQKVRQHFAMCMWKCLRKRLVWGLNPSDPPRSSIVGAPSPPQTPCRQLTSPKGVSWQERSISSHVEEGSASKLSLETK